MFETNQPAIITFQMQQEGFLFLGIENKIAGPIENTDMGVVWGNFFNVGGFEKTAPYAMKSYESMVVYHKNNSEHLVYFIGSIVTGISEVPEEYTLAKFPACEFLVVTHEWVSTKDEAIGQISPLNNYQATVQIPSGYVRYDEPDSQFILVERENTDTESGSRYEFWVPIKKKGKVT